jgi:hypothetical protein
MFDVLIKREGLFVNHICEFLVHVRDAFLDFVHHQFAFVLLGFDSVDNNFNLFVGIVFDIPHFHLMGIGVVSDIFLKLLSLLLALLHFLVVLHHISFLFSMMGLPTFVVGLVLDDGEDVLVHNLLELFTCFLFEGYLDLVDCGLLFWVFNMRVVAIFGIILSIDHTVGICSVFL